MSGLAPSRLRRAAVTVAFATAAAVLSPVAAMADAPSSVPVITLPGDGDTLTAQNLTVTATSDATHVRFVLDGRTGDPPYDVLVPVSANTATTQFSLLGFSGSTTLNAYDCDSGGLCNELDVDVVTVTVDLAAKPQITEPTDNQVVGSSVTVKVHAPGPAIQFFVDGSAVGKDTTLPIQKDVSLAGVNEGSHTITVVQCNADGTVCDGDQDIVSVVKDTKGPRWSDVSTSEKTVFPVKDRYRDSTVLSARVSETSRSTKVEIRKAGGPLVRTISLGRVAAGKVRATWNGRRSNGDVVPKGKYRFRFVGTDTHGVVGKSGDKVVYVSDKKLVAKAVTRTVSALGSGLADGSGSCSAVYRLTYRQSAHKWSKGLGYYSRSKCNGTREADTALAVHRTRAPKAVRYGAVRIDTYGGGAFRNAGPGVIVYVDNQGNAGPARKTNVGTGWNRGPSVKADRYVKNGRITWGFATVSGNWYDVKEFRLTWRIYVLQ